ncbi:hypothetical protein D1007_40138 [Hordeum vulgare]|nr:hypothetical protein D1007_40138 [Hordeum vulgare]
MLQYVIEVSALYKGAQRSADVKDMLRKYKSLVQLLQTVDFGGMKNEEKLAFWINVHNAMMMHDHIEYRSPQSNSKRMLLTKVIPTSNWNLFRYISTYSSPLRVLIW